MLRSVLIGCLGALALLAAVGSGAGAKRERPTFVKLRVVPTNRDIVLRSRSVLVSVSTVRPAVIRLVAANARAHRATRLRVLRFTRPGRRTVRLLLTPKGIRALRSCGSVHLRVNAVSRRLRRVAGARRLRVSNTLVVRRGGTTFARVRSGCRGDVIPLPPPLQTDYGVGVAARAINPGADGKWEGQPVYLGGYGIASPPASSGRPATGILGEGAHVRAFVVSAGRHAAAIADIEAQGWFAATRDGPYGLIDVRKAVAQRTGGGLTASDVVVQSDHSHSGIDAMGVWGGMPAGYRKFVLDQTADAIVEAYQHRHPAALYYGTADGRDLLSNQFDYDEQNKVVDSDVRVLQARDATGVPLATLLDFSAHATVLGASNRKVSGDWVQTANPMIADRLGGAPMTVVGTLGRTQPADRACPDTSLPKDSDAQFLCTLNDYSSRVVARAERAIAAARPLSGPAVVGARSYLIEDVTSNALLLGLLVGGGPAGAPLNRSETPPWLTGNVIGTVTASIRIGDVLLSAFPGEAYPQIALGIRALAKDYRGFMTAGLANDQLGYLIAPYTAYPEPIRRSFFDQKGDEVSPIDNDNYFFNVSHTMGERVRCSALRGAGELVGKDYRAADPSCAAYSNDLALAPGADTGP